MTTRHHCVDAAASHFFRGSLYLSGSYRQYFDSDLKSIELFTELGWRR